MQKNRGKFVRDAGGEKSEAHKIAKQGAEFDLMGRSPDHRPKRVKRCLKEQHEAFR